MGPIERTPVTTQRTPELASNTNGITVNTINTEFSISSDLDCSYDLETKRFKLIDQLNLIQNPN